MAEAARAVRDPRVEGLAAGPNRPHGCGMASQLQPAPRESVISMPPGKFGPIGVSWSIAPANDSGSIQVELAHPTFAAPLSHRCS